MIPTCDWCGGYIEAANHRHPGFCAPACRDAYRAARQELAAKEAARRRAAREQAEAEQRSRRAGAA